jgi:DNA-binding CsgD family transcriptional regulator
LYPEREIVGRNCRFLAGEKTNEGATQRLREAISSRKPIYEEILNYRSDGTPFKNGVMITPLFDDEGDLAWYLGSQVELGTSADSNFLARRSRAEALVAQLPARQREVLGGMAQGLLNKQIAWELKISEKTVKMHRALLLERLGVATSAEAIRIAVEAGL